MIEEYENIRPKSKILNLQSDVRKCQICPYTGLRSFTEEESLYFKGREENIESATEQLQRNTMLTGASGDGKSSLVYAGIIPRAGFLNQNTRNGVLPIFVGAITVQNLCKSVANQLDISNVGWVRSTQRLSARWSVQKLEAIRWFWFCCLATSGWCRQGGVEARCRQPDHFGRSNLRNFHQSWKLSPGSTFAWFQPGTVYYETARIAWKELPIYSVHYALDFIGQCAAFRVLPEISGFAVFVPTESLQLQQVIEEPATLSGNRITADWQNAWFMILQRA